MMVRDKFSTSGGEEFNNIFNPKLPTRVVEAGESTDPKPYFWLPKSKTSTEYITPYVISQLQDQISGMARQIMVLTENIQRLRYELHNRVQASSLQINNIDDSLDVLLPISLIVEENEEEVLVRWPEVRASGLGESLPEALQNIKFDIRDIYLDLNSRNPNTLGSIAIQTLSTLKTYIKIHNG
ncbi:MAG: hypothetical protein QGD88_03150 [Anaerolineae bacterium]|nr:hypothetical protein [Anaerolineae bacterium]